jgi:type IV secretory pathway TraG/TraD family ATPase VirD4
LGRTLGVDPRGITSACFHLPNGRAFVLDPSGQSVYPSSRYCLLSEIDVRKPNARALLLALATGSFPDKPGSHSDPWYTLAPRGFLAAGCGHVLTTDRDPSHHHVPFVIDRLMGIDPRTNVASPKCFEATLKAMMKNNSLDGFIQAAASNIYQLGEKMFGNLNSELETNCRWATDGYMRRHLSGPSDVKFEWLGHDGYPITIFIIPPRGDAAFQAAIPWLRTLSELSLQILQTKADVPAIPTLWVGDEYRQWGDKVAAVRNGATILRDKNVKLWLYTQSWSQIEEMFGVHGAAELESSSTIQLFGVNDLPTAERFSRRLGKWTKRERSRGGRTYRECDLATPAELMQELRLSSNLQYVFPPGTLPMRLERVAFKPLRTKDGGAFAGLPLEGHYDDGLTKQSSAARSR